MISLFAMCVLPLVVDDEPSPTTTALPLFYYSTRKGDSNQGDITYRSQQAFPGHTRERTKHTTLEFGAICLQNRDFGVFITNQSLFTTHRVFLQDIYSRALELCPLSLHMSRSRSQNQVRYVSLSRYVPIMTDCRALIHAHVLPRLLIREPP